MGCVRTHHAPILGASGERVPEPGGLLSIEVVPRAWGRPVCCPQLAWKVLTLHRLPPRILVTINKELSMSNMWTEDSSRRDFLKLAAAAGAGLMSLDGRAQGAP